MFNFLLAILSALPFGANSQQNPVIVEQSRERGSSDTISVAFDLVISPGWHVYSINLEPGGPTQAEIIHDSIMGAVPIESLTFEGEEAEKMDAMFGTSVRYFTSRVRFIQRYVVADSYYIEGALMYGVCNDEMCLPPQRSEFLYSSSDNISNTIPESVETSDILASPLWQPVKMERENSGATRGLWGIFLAGCLGGLLAIFTPCVWPIIPMTVSLFIKRSGTKRESVRDAILYGLSIIIIYVGLGLLITLIFGANALNALSTHAVPNLIFFLLLVVFALSFFGLFEISLPASWSTKFGTISRNSAGIASIFFMAFTLCLVSFSCTGPIIGFLLVEAVSGTGILMPTIGMLGFAVALALPFSLFALFPNMLKAAPKSGDWMDKLKVVLGFIELAFALKFLSVADMAYGWGILSREMFIMLWIVLALLLALYLLRVFSLIKHRRYTRPSIVEMALATLSIAFAIYLVPGLRGEPLKAIGAFAPPAKIESSNSSFIEADFTDYEEGMLYALQSGKPVLLDFTGYGCVNCRKMEAEVWVDGRVRSIIKEKYVLISLYVDDKSQLSETMVVKENGRSIKIRTVGDKWSLLQRYKFGANAQPFYVILDSEGNIMAEPYTFNPNVDSFISFLNSI